ncbi:hypothetical protein FH972_022974 [Carpinus fangiana]|uniref:Uncharacterized protein n=1 Tax=Carpinus fangiana TaxID=176857 RepID=A0A5N6KTU1_9ROSI|nr:hypothetical protein FH972_022974 [Carpinus fangiana]
MAESFAREQQNNSRLDELASKVSALRGVTVDIYDNARNQEVIDSAVSLARHRVQRGDSELTRSRVRASLPCRSRSKAARHDWAAWHSKATRLRS